MSLHFSAWLLDTDHPLLQKISKRVKLITGLETEYKSRFSNAEQYQVSVGGLNASFQEFMHVPTQSQTEYMSERRLCKVASSYKELDVLFK
jgi:hypothetical protein